MKVRTNNVPRPIVAGCELTGKQLKQARSDYDFLGDAFDDSRFIVFRGHVHYIGNFIRGDAPAGWSGLESDSAFSGTVIRISDDGDTAVMGYALSGQPNK